MSRIINKILSAITAAALLLPAQAAFATQFPDVADSASYSTAVTRLASLGIMTGDTKGNFSPDANITRAEVTKVIECTLGYDNVAKGTKGTQFVDVKPTDWFAGYANFAAMKGQMKGVIVGGKKYFKPTSNMTFGEFITLAIRSLGYTDTDLPGTWPMNYIATANDLALFNGMDVVLDPNDPIKRSDVAIVVSNLLDANPKSEAAKDNPKTLFQTVMPRLGFTAVPGLLTTNTTDPTIPADKVQIGSTYYGINMTNPNDLLKYSGYNVNVYVRKGSVVSLNTAVPIVGSSVTGTATADVTSTGSLNYLDASGIQRSLSINQGAKIYVNGISTSNPTDIRSGATIYAVQWQANEVGYDYIVASQTFGPYIQSSDVTTNDPVALGNIGYIVSGSNVTANTPTTISLKKTDGTAANVIVTGAASKLSEIKRNDVLYVSSTSNNAIVRINDFRKTVAGQVTATTVPVGTTPGTITINGAQYNVRIGANINFQLGSSYVCLLDSSNTIVGIDSTQTTAGSYNYSADNVGFLEQTAINPNTLQSVTSFQARIRKLDGTYIIASTDRDYSGFSHQLVYFTNNTSNGTISIATNVIGSTTMPNKANITQNTRIYNFIPNTDGLTYKVQNINYSSIASSSINLANYGCYYILAPGNQMGDYAIIAFVNANIGSSSNIYGIAPSSTNGGAMVPGTTTASAVYNAYVNGKATTLYVQPGLSVPNYFSGYTADSTGLITSFAPVNGATPARLITTAPNDLVYADNSAVAAGTSGRIKFNSLGILYNLDATAQVYNIYNGTIKVDSIANVNNVTWAQIVVDPTSSNVVMVIINKAD